ncbi:zf-HC2 domain-containing protein [Marinobacterium ramblicola]|uniref:zf-HC2 domain-containing protein n=1 Tax=Marinobacterium ramblicola TaxID=2849041 RepID=UPI001FEC67B8|nr:zf-HC2 domain-containing protein [Marinobacterium ramblicola]
MTMACKRATELMSLRIDRELTLAEKSSLRLHLAICRYCRRCEKQMAMLHRIAARRRENCDQQE